MKTSVYELLLFHRPQALADLDSFQRHWHNCGITCPAGDREPAVILDSLTESSEEIGRLMSQPPASPSELRSEG